MFTSPNSPILSKAPRVFLLCCDMRNFSKVAKALGMTQSSVSKIIQAFEEELGFELFIRGSRPAALTPEAVMLQQFLKRVSSDCSAFVNEYRNRKSIHPVLRLGILESLSLNLGVEIVRRSMPATSQIKMITASANVMFQRLEERKVDLIITHGSYGEKFQQTFRRPLFLEPSILVFPKSMSSVQHPWTWERLASCGLPLITYWRETGAGQLNELFLRSHDIHFSQKVVVDTNALMIMLVTKGLGWCITRPTTVLENKHLLDHLHIAPMENPLLMRDVFLVGRDGEFEKEGAAIADISKDYVKRVLIPQIKEFAPWTEDLFSISD